MSNTSSREQDKSTEELQEYWTEERRSNAKPKPMPVISEEKTGEDDDDQDQGSPVVTPPNTSIVNIAGLYPSDAPGRLALKGKGFGPNVLAQPVTTPASWPYSCNGKLFFSWNGGDYVGSAGSIFLEVLLTAGHNIYDEGQWSTNFLYYPGYPVYGKSWGWTRAAVFTAWQSGNFDYDYAMILTSSSMAEVGSIGAITSVPPTGLTWSAYGYPSAAPYPGNQMYVATGSYVSGTSQITMNNNDMTQGSSGGVWLTNYNGQYGVNGVQSHRLNSQPTYAISPYLNTNDFQTLLQCAATGQCN